MTTKLGFIGFGIMGERLLRAGLDHQGIAISGIFDPASSAAARLKAIDPKLKAFGSAADVIAASDVLHIASPPSSHLDYLAQCAAAGRAALCEKPLATDVDAASNAVADLKAKGMRAAVNFPFASSLAVDVLKSWIAEGAVGTPERVDIVMAFKTWPRPWQMDAVRWLDATAEGGFLREVGSHFLFLSRRLIGPLQLESGASSYPEAGKSERRVSAKLTAGGLPVSVEGGVGTTGLDDHNTWTLTGSKGRIRLRDWSIAEREIDGRWQPPADAMPNEKARPLVLSRQLDKVIEMTAGRQTALASLEEALNVQRVVETILANKA